MVARPSPLSGRGTWAERPHPTCHHFGVVLQLGKDVPVAFQEHCALLREEGGAGSSLGKVGLVRAPVVLLKTDVELHGLFGGRLGKARLGLVIVQDVAAGLIHKVPVAKLVRRQLGI